LGKSKYRVLVLGAGAGGISLAARLARKIPSDQIAIIDPSENHFYQPMWTIAGAGLASAESTRRKQSALIPKGVTWLRETVQSVDPIARKVLLSHDLALEYDYLVVATGLRLAWEKIEGLKGNLGKNGICSVYEFDHVDYTAGQIQGFQGGTAVFVMPPVPIKCAGAPQKIMYLAENVFRLNGVRHKSKIIFATAGKAMFGIPTFSNALEKIVHEKGIEPKYMHKISGVDAEKKEAIFDVTDAEGKVTKQTLKFDLLHVVPPMTAHSYVAESGLAFESGDQKGWLQVDKHTLQHLKYPNIFGVGDVTGVPNSKTGAAIRSQYPVVAENLLAVMNGKNPTASYNGYSSCPLITEIGKVMLAEFGYDGKLMPTFPLDPAVPRRTMWHLKKDILPHLYWQGMLKGLA
jgi:sulfide:quinone oxidoreductase